MPDREGVWHLEALVWLTAAGAAHRNSLQSAPCNDACESASRMIRGGVCRQLRRPAKDNTSEPINCFEGDQQPEMRRSGQKTAARAQISLVG
jgi:hypothetical protein